MNLATGDIVLCDLSPVAGRELGGRRPVVVVSHPRYAIVPGLFIGVPLTSTDRDLMHHVSVPADDEIGLTRASYAMTEQVRVLSRLRVDRTLGEANPLVQGEISLYVHKFIA